MQRQVQFIIRGMTQDSSISKATTEYSYENMNIRISANGKDTLLSVTNEKGNRDTGIQLEGTFLGGCTLNNTLIVFTHGNADIIYKVEYTDAYLYTKKILFLGNLNFSAPIEAIGIYENENIQKVYWTDGINQLRVINIASTETFTSDSFDFIQNIDLKEHIEVHRNMTVEGEFPSGVIQYSFSYCNRYGQETNIFHTTPLYYTSYEERGGSPENKLSNSFTIVMGNLDRKFDCIRIYSTFRTSVDSTVSARRVADLYIKESGTALYIDTGTSGDSIDPKSILYVGGDAVSASTLTCKDNTLFLGNIKILNKDLNTIIRDRLYHTPVVFRYKKTSEPPEPSGIYPYKNSLDKNSYETKLFKYLEWYRLGVQLQDSTGKWSEPIYITDKKNTFPLKNSYTDRSDIQSACPSAVLSKDALNVIRLHGYIRIRPIIVYPEYSDRECVCQGILCPTVYNVGDRSTESPFAQSSWFVRPNMPYDIDQSLTLHDWKDREANPSSGTVSINSRAGTVSDPGKFMYKSTIYDLTKKGTWIEFRHNHPIPSNIDKKAEIQCIYEPPEDPLIGQSPDMDSWVSDNSENYYVDQSIVTLHSPDIEFDDYLKNTDITGLKLRIIGVVPITSCSGTVDVQTSSAPNIGKISKTTASGFHKTSLTNTNISRFGSHILSSGAFWRDYITEDKRSSKKDIATGFIVYPWHRNGSLNNTAIAKDGYKSALLTKKKLSNIRYSYNTLYLSEKNIWYSFLKEDVLHTGISGAAVFDSNEMTLIKVPAPLNSGLDPINYYGNIDKVLNISRTGNKEDGYPIVIIGDEQNIEDTVDFMPYTALSKETSDQCKGTDPVRIKYKSGSHAVIALNYSKDHRIRVLPTIKDGDNASLWDINTVNRDIPKDRSGRRSKRFFWDTSNTVVGVSQDSLNLAFPYNNSFDGKGPEYGFLWLGELYNDNIQNRFGGTTPEAIEANKWLPCGEPVSVAEDNVEIVWQEGDTYYQRYDCLKTYPFTLEDQNAVTDIVSFMCETRINLDGRYDKNRGQTNNFAVNPENFNKLNPVYNQKNNFFTYRSINPSILNVRNFQNTIVWSKEKSYGELNDTWTNINVASSLGINGDRGKITALRIFNNEIICFQENGVSSILFNSRVQIPVSDGIPIEITNGMKVQGPRYYSTIIGCNDRQSIVQTSRGIYFIDGNDKTLYRFNGQFDPLSTRLGFRIWFKDNCMDITGFSDVNNGDVYYITKDHCIVYSELLEQFESFMNYEGVSYMANIKDRFLSLKDCRLWEQNTGDYNMFFGSFKPYWVIYRVAPEETVDKIFTNAEYRADVWDGETLTTSFAFDKLEVWNEYQHGSSVLKNMKFSPSALKKKFRIWKSDIPRDDSNHRDRIRNTWINLKLEKSDQNINRMEFHDMTVKYW